MNGHEYFNVRIDSKVANIRSQSSVRLIEVWLGIDATFSKLKQFLWQNKKKKKERKTAIPSVDQKSNSFWPSARVERASHKSFQKEY